jgi:hypothetical protein
MVNSNISKRLYKVFLGISKYIPLFLSVIFIINTLCAYFKIHFPMLMYIGGVSFTLIVLLYLLSWVFQFCHLYRIPLHYVTIGNFIGIVDTHWVIPLSSIAMIRIYFILFGVMLVAYIWFMYKNRNNPKVDYIKQLCETYCDCNC